MTLHRSLFAAGLLLMAGPAAISAQAADLDIPATDLWTGFYLGAQAGYLQGTGSDTDICFSAEGFGSECFGKSEGIDFGDSSADGATAGGYLGFNYRMNAIVMGLEGDLNWDNASGNNTFADEVSYNTSLNWDASIRARLGIVVDERALLYVTGGPSWLNTELDSSLFCSVSSSIDVKCGDSSTEFGWQLGAGAEFFMTDHLSVKAEYLHGWYGDANLDLASADVEGTTEKFYLKQNLQTNVVRAGVAYHFGGF
jgi:outer membrane immunogenic protein